MSELRNKLDQAKAEHLSAHYPGNLALDVLPEHRRRVSRRILFVGGLTASARARFLGSYAEFVRGTAFAPSQLIGTLEGGVRGTHLVARATLTMVPVPGRLAVIRRETE